MKSTILNRILILVFIASSQLLAESTSIKTVVGKNVLARLRVKDASALDSAKELDADSKKYYKELFSDWDSFIVKEPTVITPNPSLQAAHSALRYLAGSTDLIAVETAVPPGFLYWPNIGTNDPFTQSRVLDLKLSWLEAYLKQGKVGSSPQLFAVARAILTDIGNAEICINLTELHFAKIVNIYSLLIATTSHESRQLIPRLLITYPIAAQIARKTYVNYINTLLLKSGFSEENATTADSSYINLLAINLFLLKKIKEYPLNENSGHERMAEDVVLMARELVAK